MPTAGSGFRSEVGREAGGQTRNAGWRCDICLKPSLHRRKYTAFALPAAEASGTSTLSLQMIDCGVHAGADVMSVQLEQRMPNHNHALLRWVHSMLLDAKNLI